MIGAGGAIAVGPGAGAGGGVAGLAGRHPANLARFGLDGNRRVVMLARPRAAGGTLTMGYKVAVAGATGAVGHEILSILAEREFPADEVVALASKGSEGREVSFGDERLLKVRALETFDFEGTDLGLFSPGAAISKVHAPRAAAAGCIVIDNTSQFRMDERVPLVVPEVNPEALERFRERNIIANPNCSTIQLVMALKPLHDLAVVRRVVVATYQSVSGAGREAMDELFDQTKGIYETREPRPSPVPQADRLQRDPADRRPGRGRHVQGRVEDDGRDPEDPRPRDRGRGDLRARAGVRRPLPRGRPSSSSTRSRSTRRARR